MTQTFSSTGHDTFVGSPRSRIDGPAKVTGLAKYAGEFAAPDLAYGTVVSSAIAKGRIAAIDSAAAEAVPGVLKVITPAPPGATRTSRTRWRRPDRRSAPSTTT
jgi:xanthine dehydrogenase YagR molybdenum-binding subunit